MSTEQRVGREYLLSIFCENFAFLSGFVNRILGRFDRNRATIAFWIAVVLEFLYYER